MTDKQAPESRGTEVEPIGHVVFRKSRRAPDVDWALDRDVTNGMPLFASPEAAAEEPIRMAYKTGYDEGYSDGSDGSVDHDAAEEGWQQYRALLATQRSTEPADGWISVKETPIPRDGGSFIVTDGKSVAPHVRGVISNNPGTSWDWQYGEAITHWMPLPNAPGREPEQAVRGDAGDEP